MKTTTNLPATTTALLALLLLTFSSLTSLTLASPVRALLPRDDDAATMMGEDAESTPPPMWSIKCPREVQGVCTPDDKVFFCTSMGYLVNELSATCSACACRSSATLVAARDDATTTATDAAEDDGSGSGSGSGSTEGGSSPPLWTIKCPREVQGVCTPDDKLFFCTMQGMLWNQLSATCSSCVCRAANNAGRPADRRV